jgi:hypothetical protein
VARHLLDSRFFLSSSGDIEAGVATRRHQKSSSIGCPTTVDEGSTKHPFSISIHGDRVEMSKSARPLPEILVRVFTFALLQL